ncbi:MULTISPECIES: preprotein translocase subunit YajC [unclassified Gilliamella]|uniref:preprotein translocase subunit YajC n=1 Tax=unclassified Gilliamella TaxID=2685620 RepID=UPI00080E8ACD|nr:preprotein translocase subunit YajC [Gilliamella apicola]OCG20151.1 preprotein translocase subunit YajC [Gilliamella apicola]OCG23079.1 preprotein translocase subunit YajC [Gilliamella apicola]
MNFLISNAYAADGNQPGGDYFLPIMLVVFGLFFYFMIMRPQQKRVKEYRELMASISKGDEVLTKGGIIGRVAKVNENGYIALELNETSEIVIKRDYITSILPKGTMKSL